jgi:hypothetical protein
LDYRLEETKNVASDAGINFSTGIASALLNLHVYPCVGFSLDFKTMNGSINAPSALAGENATVTSTTVQASGNADPIKIVFKDYFFDGGVIQVLDGVLIPREGTVNAAEPITKAILPVVPYYQC